MRDECLKLHSKCGHLKKPMDVVRSGFASDLCGCQAALHGHSNDWSSVSTALTFYEEQPRTCELGPAAAELFLKSSAIIAARKAIRKRTEQRKREERENAKEGGKTRPQLSAVGLLEVIERRNIFHRLLSLTIARWVKAEWLKWKSGCVLLTFSVPGWP